MRAKPQAGTLPHMDKQFFETFDDRKKEFAGRAGEGEEVTAELVLGNGRIYRVDKIVETTDSWLHADVHEPDDDSRQLSVVLPYYQITQVLFERPKPRMRHAGFSR
ncbi:MAG TPA: hypothetical protein VJ891_11235 [Casimicrobiaceae bacterium]|nr:hypothetical protein [Casimicrobiaceae bacterium]